MSVSSEFGRRAADDELCAAVAKAVADDDADALRRLGFSGWGDYVQRLSELMNESVRDELEQSDDFGALMSQVARPARYAHHLVTESGTAVQTAKDTPLGIHIKPLEPEFDDDALKGTVGTAASMDDPERAVETLADGLAYAVKKAGNDFIKANAEQRSRAGFEVKVKRSGSTKCCPWCAARIGSWALKNAPDGVFGCHANCSCTVEYTSSTGAVPRREGTGRFVEVDYQPPHVLSREEAKEKGGFDEPKRLNVETNGVRELFHLPPKEFGKHLISDAERDIINSGIPYLDSKPRLKENGISYCLRTTNPDRDKSEGYQLNCQRSVIAYEARRRGFDVVAKPKQSFFGIDLFSLSNDRRGWSSAFENGYDSLESPTGKTCSEIKDYIINKMKEYGDGSRIIISVAWNEETGHAFIAEQVNGETHFIDPQKNIFDVSEYFKDGEFIPGETRILRIDDKRFTKSIEEAVT